MRTILECIKKPLNLFLRPLCRLSCKIRGYKEERNGSCSFNGSADFLVKCRNAFLKLQEYDLEMSSSILAVPWFIYASGRKSILSIEQKICGISDRWLKWGELGIIAYIVYVQTKRLYKLEQKKPLLQQTERAVADWLKQRQFPDNLINSFDPKKNQSL